MGTPRDDGDANDADDAAALAAEAVERRVGCDCACADALTAGATLPLPPDASDDESASRADVWRNGGVALGAFAAAGVAEAIGA